MKFLFKIILSIFLMPIPLSTATDKKQDIDSPIKNAPSLTIFITREMRYKAFEMEEQKMRLLEEAATLGIANASDMDFNVLSMAVHKAKLQNAVDTKS